MNWFALIWVFASVVPISAFGQTTGSAPTAQIEEIIVTAEKSEQSANTVGMSITAATDEVLRARGITSVADLMRLVPGFTIQESSFDSTSFTLRGVGFFNSDLGTPPAVTVYVDEAPLPYPAMTRLTAFDLARVEVLKGPQGTIFGQNATGGAVNYIAAKPTETFEARFDATHGRFDVFQVGGFVSGPIGDHLSLRLAAQTRRAEPWQESVTRPGDELGRVRELQSRAILEWRPNTRFTSRLALTATRDGSESTAAQFIAPAWRFPELVVPGLLTFPIVTRPRAADWTSSELDTDKPFPYERDTTLYQATWRNDYSARDDITLTSLTSYADFHSNYGHDPDGTPYHVTEVIDRDGSIDAFFQELRATAKWGKSDWLVGANYAHDEVREKPLQLFRDNDAGRLFEGIDPEAYADEGVFASRMRAETRAVFGRLELEVTERLTVEGGIRYNSDRRTFDNCSITVSEHFARYWNLFRGGAQPPTELGDCWVLDAANGLQPVDNVHSTLDQDSRSWRAGLVWTARSSLTFYGNASKGFKAGAAPVLAASTTLQLAPVPQESLLAYEVGLKAALFERRGQLNASAFHYDYKNKQLRGAVLDPVFGPLEALVSIPQSHVTGAEMQLVVHLAEGLILDTSVTYLDTEIDDFMGFDALAQFGDHSGTPFPFSPEWQSITNLDYGFDLSSSMTAFAGVSLIYNSSTFAGVGALETFRIDPFTLLDLRAGVEIGDARYRVWVWGKNVTDEYYWTNVFAGGNAISRFPGRPVTFGVSLSARF